MKKLKVPYYSQWDIDATFSRDDCIPCCVSMILSYYGVNLTTDQIAKKIGTQGLVNFNQIKNALSSFGYNIVGNTGKTLNNLRKAIDGGDPFLAIIHYGDLAGRQDTYIGGHAVVVKGYDDDRKVVITNDPDFWGTRRNEGESKEYSMDAFNKAWQSTADGNARGNLWYLDLEKPSLDYKKMYESTLKLLVEYKIKTNKEIEALKEDLRLITKKYKDLLKKQPATPANVATIVPDKPILSNRKWTLQVLNDNIIGLTEKIKSLFNGKGGEFSMKFINSLKTAWELLPKEIKVACFIATSYGLSAVITEIGKVQVDSVWLAIAINILLVFLKELKPRIEARK